jgi:hypothetical protein
MPGLLEGGSSAPTFIRPDSGPGAIPPASAPGSCCLERNHSAQRGSVTQLASSLPLSAMTWPQFLSTALHGAGGVERHGTPCETWAVAGRGIRAIQELCRAHGATLFVDCAHDLGALGSTGRGVLEEQGIVGGVDVLMGSFSKTFASNGGFVACNNPALKFGLRYNCGPSTFTNAMTPIQAAVVLAALAIVNSNEGAERRRRLLHNSERLRARPVVRQVLAEEGYRT